MTPQIDQMCDELAELLGWRKYYPNDRAADGYFQWQRLTECGFVAGPDAGQRHPIDTLDSLAEIWREELPSWEWERRHTIFRGRWDYLWYAEGESAPNIVGPIHDTGDEYHDRLALTLAAVKASKGGSR